MRSKILVSEALEEQVQNLSVAVATFKVDEGDGSAVAARCDPAPVHAAVPACKPVPAKVAVNALAKPKA